MHYCRAAVIAHGSIFAILGRDIYAHLDRRGRKIFRDTVDFVAAHFFLADMSAWRGVFDALNDPRLGVLERDAIALGAEYDANIDYTNDNNGLRRFYYAHMGWDRDC